MNTNDLIYKLLRLIARLILHILMICIWLVAKIAVVILNLIITRIEAHLPISSK